MSTKPKRLKIEIIKKPLKLGTFRFPIKFLNRNEIIN
jgi:hypothetical protein